MKKLTLIIVAIMVLGGCVTFEVKREMLPDNTFLSTHPGFMLKFDKKFEYKGTLKNHGRGFSQDIFRADSSTNTERFLWSTEYNTQHVIIEFNTLLGIGYWGSGLIYHSSERDRVHTEKLGGKNWKTLSWENDGYRGKTFRRITMNEKTIISIYYYTKELTLDKVLDDITFVKN